MPYVRKRKGLALALELQFGEGSDELIAQLKRIAFGQPITVPGPLPGTSKVLTPTISEMRDACLDLLAYQHGRPRQMVEVTPTAPEKWRPEALTLEELEQMDALARKGLVAGVVEGEFKTDPEKEEP